jgi:Zn-dependent M16 (insulinase) family peptidase
MLGFFSFSTVLNSAELEIGKVYHGFKFLKKQKIKEYDAEGLLFEHVKSGARLIKILAKDDNKTFMITFKTIPDCDCGMPHILEHSVLNGSKHFPVKSPFDVLIKGSLKTFLNAMTASDHTMYPVSSRNNKDYFNLMHVYLDAVFFPNVLTDKRIFMQEGWHYELNNKDGELSYNGVVYNEMKGVYSSPESYLEYYINKNLFPDNTYHYESGGHPDSIPKLSYERFVKFYKRFYHPSNSYIYLYGDYDLMKELKFINDEYLSHFNKIDVNAFIPVQKPFSKMKEIVKNYPVSKTAKIKNQTFLNLSIVVGMGTDTKLNTAMSILSSVLVNLPSAPIRQALRKAGIGREVSAYFDGSRKQSVLSITVKNANPEDAVKFKEIVYETLKEVANKGIDKKVLKGLINRKEFKLREPKSGYKGLMLGMSMNSGWMFKNDPFLTVGFNEDIKSIKTGLKNNYFEKLIIDKLVKNNHALLTVLKPKLGLMEENIARVKKELADYKAKLSDKQLEEMVEQTKALKKYQQAPNSPEALKTIPLLSLKDIKPREDFYSIKKKTVNGINYLTYPVFTNNIVYGKLIFDLRTVPQKLIPYASLLSEVLGLLNTEKYTYGELSTEININMGGVNTYLDTYLKKYDSKKIIPKFVFSAKIINDKTDKVFELADEVILKTKFDDKKRLKHVLMRIRANLESMTQYNGLGLAMTRLRSYLSPYGKMSELTNGLSYYKFVKGLTQNYDKNSTEIINNLKKVASLIFNRNNIEIAVTASEKDIEKFIKASEKLIKELPNKKVKSNDYKFEFNIRNEGITSPSKVQYVLQGYNYKDLGYKYSGKMLVLNQILSTDYLQEQIRVLGGAYGGFAGFSKSGFGYFGSYRDPHLRRTLKKYKEAVEYLKNFKANERAMTRYIIGTLSKYEMPPTPQMEGEEALSNYYQGVKKEEVLRERREILKTTPEDIRGFAKMIKDLLNKNYYCVYGNEKKLKDNKQLFTVLLESK